ncbi:MAG: HDOD domain-containing protein [Myxococcota bacterium]
MRGTVIGPYRIVTELGSGGMGSVWYAEHQEIGRRAAIKILHRDFASDASLVDRFFKEAQAVNRIRHPNIVQIDDVGTHEDQPYLVMEFLEGETLGARLERERTLDLRSTTRISREVAMALAAAHEKGIVHRDLKPENVFLCARDDGSDEVKVLDFGVAKLTREGVSKHTGTGVIIGTPAYMSPEQCVGDKKLDFRSDVYSLGILTYEMLTGEPPFVGDSFGRYVVAHTSEAPISPSVRDNTIPNAVSAVVLQALEKSPADRFRSTRDYADELSRAQRKGKSGNQAEQRQLETRQSQSVAGHLQQICAERLADGRFELPSMPRVVTDALGVLQSAEVDFGKLGALLETDPFVTARLLKIVNSPLYGGREKVRTVPAAISRLGIVTLRSLLVTLSAREVFQSRDPRIRNHFRTLWDHCVGVATLARELGRHIEGVEGNVAYLAGLLHDVGKPVAGAFLLEAERQLLDALGEPWMSDSVFRLTVDALHRDLGIKVATTWDMPDEVVAAIQNQASYVEDAETEYGNLVRYCDALASLYAEHQTPAAIESYMQISHEGRTRFGLTEALEERARERFEVAVGGGGGGGEDDRGTVRTVA